MATEYLAVASTEPTSLTAAALGIAQMDKDLSDSMDSYLLKGWILLQDGCPDCSTPLMRNQEATNQVCVNCIINPPVDPEEFYPDQAPQTIQDQSEVEQSHVAPRDPQPSHPLVSPTPASPQPTDPSPTLSHSTNDPLLESSSAQSMEVQAAIALPPSTPPKTPMPAPLRPLSPPNHGDFVKDREGGRRGFRAPSGRIIGIATGPNPTSADFPRPPVPLQPKTFAPLPMPPTTPPPLSKISSRQFPNPPSSPPPGSGLASPPMSPMAPQHAPRERKRSSPPSSVMMQNGMILPPPRGMVSAPIPPVALPSPPLTGVAGAEIGVQGRESMTLNENRRTRVKSAEKRSVLAAPAAGAGEESESHDEFLEAAEEMNSATTTATATTILAQQQQQQQQEAAQGRRTRATHERTPRLLNDKMLPGWTMLQEVCRNATCNGVPLMRSREKDEVCIACETVYRRGPSSSSQTTTSGAIDVFSAANAATVALASLPLFPAPPTTAPTTPSAPCFPASITSGSPPARPTPSSSNGGSGSGSARSSRGLNGGRISSPILLPPASPPPSFGQILSRPSSDDLEKLTSDEEETQRHLQVIGNVREFVSRSLPPVPSSSSSTSLASLALSSSSSSSSSLSSTSSGYSPNEKSRHARSSPQHVATSSSINAHYREEMTKSTPAPTPAPTSAPAPAPAPPTPEVQAIISATHKTISVLLMKLEFYRLSLEEAETPKECQAHSTQIKNIMECLKACREVL